ncbi:sensor histidine kinase [Alkalihalobacillus alcalophilus ATCC 27647 = CGMCC 1.3604]|uniref:histidine kinase n=1 Tax=Alkalihalobacillus alcalophilus ATCC 27647 = CGMCC 1.3604 TaxID=1218173 RepID=A0A094WLB5_ALKAL|nr:ATP-binding protein [Alkalihalobacillus alcalophilus]KGA98549.1 histidine kinase [Alkalihalobacillus alcalophilus ATCC 27647 = CGMCC 1.3604]THG89188.1 sensor histidine kinase [Alkalihalobacillus alcalophilus ATCC 27647 = CGMCC 1.3604]
MLWRSVVGKLWFTFLLLVTVVLTILMVMLLRSFEKFHIQEAESQLVHHANMIANIYDGYTDQDEALMRIGQYTELLEINIILVNQGKKVMDKVEPGSWNLPLEVFYQNERLSQVFEGQSVVIEEGKFMLDDSNYTAPELMVAGVPLRTNEVDNSAVFLYQSLDVIEETSRETKGIIYLSAGIAIVLTTIFAFFLSTRITAPLRRMREAALELARGKFESKIPIVSHDEIGLLGMAFNRMARDLNVSMTELNQEKEQLSRILISMADGVITFNRQGEVMITNPPAERFLESWLYEDGVINQEMTPVELNNLFQKVVAGEKEQQLEMNIQGRSWAILMTPLYDADQIRGAVAVIRDMTEERQHDKLRKDFIANVSHELRTPISMLQGYSEAIIDDIAESHEEKKELARIIYDESLRMGRLVNELLDIARMEAGYVDLQKDEMDIHTFIQKVVRKFNGLAKDEEISLNLETIADLPTGYFDPDRIEQVLTNLIHNALRHTPKGGRVTVKVNRDENYFLFDVDDNGSGIAEQDLPYVFERFYKADKARTRAKGGTGLGLAIAKNIIDSHKGEITVRSKLNEGTCFSFKLPII